MNKPKFVAVSQRVRYEPGYKEFRDELDHRYIEWILASGNIPVPVPNSLLLAQSAPQSIVSSWLESFNIEAILLSGGNDIGEFEARDQTENQLLTWAEKQSCPVLGICRGMQYMAVRDGAELVKVEGHAGTRHPINITKQGQIGSRVVNSYHNFAVQSCPKSFEPIATSEQGHVEAIYHKTLPWQAWMWHPEREPEFDTGDLKQFQELINHVRS